MAGYKDYVLEFKLGDGTMHSIPFRVPLGENGGYYTPAISQISETEIEIRYVPSMADMPTIKPAVIKIPTSGGNTGGNVEKHNIDPTAHADIRKRLATSNIVETASGDVVTISDASATNLVGLKVYGKTTQNGTSLNSVGNSGTIKIKIPGKNLLSSVKFPATSVKNGVSITNHGDGSISIKGTATTNTTISFAWNGDGSKLEEIFRQGGRFIFSCDRAVYHATTFNCTISYKVNGSTKYIRADRQPFDIPAGAEYQNISIWISSGTTIDTIENAHLQLEIGNAATEYEPYNVKILSAPTPNGLSGIPVTSTGNYTDKNGQQWICDEVDFEKGVLIQRIGEIESYSGEAIGEIYLSSTGTLSTGATVLYPLKNIVESALAEEILLSYATLHTNYPSTIIFNDGGADMEVKYVADTKLYIDKKFAELSTALLNQ
jgi:hypothetical protein